MHTGRVDRATKGGFAVHASMVGGSGFVLDDLAVIYHRVDGEAVHPTVIKLCCLFASAKRCTLHRCWAM